MVPVLGLARSVPGLAGSSAPVPAADPRTLGGDLWHSVAPLCGGAILPELYPGLLRTGTMLPIGASHAGAHPSDASALCQMLLQDAGPSAGHHLDAPPGWPCHKRRHGDTVTAGRCCLLPMMTPAQQPAARPGAAGAQLCPLVAGTPQTWSPCVPAAPHRRCCWWPLGQAGLSFRCRVCHLLQSSLCWPELLSPKLQAFGPSGAWWLQRSLAPFGHQAGPRAP